MARRAIRGFVAGLVLGVWFVGCTGPDVEVVMETVELADRGISVTYPSGWYLADDTLTPNLVQPSEVLSLGTFPLVAGGPNCAQIPSQALHDMEPTDVFLTVQETGPLRADTPRRPDRFGPTPGSTNNVFYECMAEEERTDIGEIHWLSFGEGGRGFAVAVAIGHDATPEDESAVWNVLDELVIEPKE